MKIENASLSDHIKTSILNYSRLGIDIAVIEDNPSELVVRIAQKRLINNVVLTQKELIERGKEIFKDFNKPVKVRPLVYAFDLREISPQWLEEKMKSLGIRINDIEKQVHIPKAKVKEFLKGCRNLRANAKASLFWYIKTFEINNSHREYLKT